MFDYTQFTDAQLIAARLRGDNQAFDTLVVRYKSLVYTIPMRFGMSTQEADDVFQSVWLLLLENLPALKQPDRVKAWLVTTTKRECFRRRKGTRYEREETTDPQKLPADRWAETQTPEQILLRYEKHHAMRQAIKQLSGRCERLLNYLFYDPTKPDYTFIAAQLGMQVGSIGPTRGRCLKKLKKLLTGR